jgi:putative YphP/YqiW family bacilliredoxin
MYPAEIVAPMKEDLTSAGFQDCVSVEDVDQVLKETEGTVLMVVNSVCGCAAGMARPGVKMAVSGSKKPTKLATVFAGVDKDATEQARRYMLPYPPSSPSIALFKNGRLVHMLERHNIEGHSAELISENLQAAFDEFVE